jgi:hypothetical protein
MMTVFKYLSGPELSSTTLRIMTDRNPLFVLTSPVEHSCKNL